MTGVSVDRGVERIAEAFERARADGRRAALMPYMMAGFPTLAASFEVARAYVEGGADLIELGMPFSDPLADGPAVHAAATRALANGVRLADCLEVARAVSQQVPVVLMGYVNPILARGIERFCDLLLEAGICGVIVPDLPLEESATMRSACDARGLALVPLVAPNTSNARMAEIGACARGFLYTVAVAGTTGERPGESEGPTALLARARAACTVPVALGFGISAPEQAAAAAAAGADGVIVGSRFIRAAGEDADGVRELVTSFAAALK